MMGNNTYALRMAIMTLLGAEFDAKSVQFLQFTRIFEDEPLHYSAARRAFVERFGSAYNFGTWLRKMTEYGYLEVKHSKRVFGKKTCWIGLPGFDVPDDKHLCEVKRERARMHNHLVRALEQSCADFGLKFVRLHSYFSKYPSRSLDDARGCGVKKTVSVEFSVRVPRVAVSPRSYQNLRILDRLALRKRGYL